jgi:hypothetical protein
MPRNSIFDQKKKEFNRVRRQWKNVFDEFVYVKSVFDKAVSELNIIIIDIVGKYNLDSPFAEDDSSEEPKKKLDEENSKMLFRKVAMMSHPDQSNIDDADLFRKLTEAKKQGNVNKIYDLAGELDIKYEDTSFEQLDKMKDEVFDCQKKIKKMTVSVYWDWHHASNKEKKIILNNLTVNLINEQENKNKKNKR